MSTNPWTVNKTRKGAEQKPMPKRVKAKKKKPAPKIFTYYKDKKVHFSGPKDKILFPDIGELGWSMYLLAHIKWLKQNAYIDIGVMTYPHRMGLHTWNADTVFALPESFYNKFGHFQQGCLSLNGAKSRDLVQFFNTNMPKGYRMAPLFKFECFWPIAVFTNFGPYPYRNKVEKVNGKSEILVFPRARKGAYAKRNLPKSFYEKLVNKLCIAFPNLNIRLMGTESGAYDIKSPHKNYINWIGKDDDVQALVDRCQVAHAAVGSQSAPPKITLLQGVPTYMIGHQQLRHESQENWMNTRVGFFAIDSKKYNQFDNPTCIEKIIDFIKNK